MASNPKDQSQFRRRRTTEDRVRNALNNGVTPSFFRWVMQAHPQSGLLPNDATIDSKDATDIEPFRYVRGTRADYPFDILDDDDKEWQQGLTADDLAGAKKDILPSYNANDPNKLYRTKRRMDLIVTRNARGRAPQQRNGYDCGLHVIRNAEIATRPAGVDADLPAPPVEPDLLRAHYRKMVKDMTVG
ncbi:uncharacterized protein GLRG_11230 [Colletotrichum graminicola M1.001]|uniref:Uncharacterized protein n=1 Tax=Colletotrichum graminicola (strain M1.001 / M2 / FGSC 10212) TaxID=645133 RepID=E3QYZ8_COLGM|nr:uncharacterized protein GLRG_11230 [Colletotrichum graminicola M1.001]EFQ36086.1 hypothetical protein GLRG_11230 [Colletotrichum graminicola M1.001]